MITKGLRLCKLAGIPALLLTSHAFAGGIQLDTSYSSAGYAWAGRAALYDDPSTGYYNPAVYSAFCHPVINLGAIFADFNPDVKMLESQIAVGNFTPTIPTVGNDRATIGGWNILAGVSAVLPLPYNFSAGVNVSMPWGLTLNYPRSSKSRYFAQYAALKVVDIDPGVAFQIVNGFSVGVGLDATYSNAETSLAFPTIFPTSPTPTFGTASDTYVQNENGESWAFGWNAGLLYRAPTGTHIGLGYHSKISTTTKGDSSAVVVSQTGPTTFTATELSGTARSTFIFPAFANLSIVQEIGPCWQILADIRYTNWDKVDKNTVDFSGDVASDTPGIVDNGVPNVNLRLDWRDSFNYSVGVSYKPSEEWKLKAGFGYDETPVPDSKKRPFLIPDSNRYVFGLGAQYCINKNFHIDAGYTLKIFEDADIEATQNVPAPPAPIPVTLTSNAKVDTIANEFTVSFSWTIT